MTNKESDRFSLALSNQQFNAHNLKVVLTILEGNGVYNQEDIIILSKHNCSLLRKLGWLRKVKTAIKEAGFQMTYIDCDE